MKLSLTPGEQKTVASSEIMKYGLWTAPELLRSTEKIASRECDVYGFGIIVQELVLEGPPYCDNEPELEYEKIVEKVRSKESPPYRPDVKIGIYIFNFSQGVFKWAYLMIIFVKACTELLT